MPSVATIESVLRLSAPVQLRVSVPVQLRVSAPVQFRLGPASQRAECREVSVPDWLVDWLPPSAEWSRECLSPFSPPPNRPPREVSVPDWLVDWLPPSAEWSRECLSQIGWSIGCRRTQSEAESVCPRSACFCCAQRLSVLNQFLQSVSPRGCLSRPSPDHPGPVSAGGVKTVELISVNCSD